MGAHKCCRTLSHSAPQREGEACLRSPKAPEDQLINVSQQSLGDLSVTPRKRGNICSAELCGGASAAVSHHRAAETLSKAEHSPCHVTHIPPFNLSPSSHGGCKLGVPCGQTG